MSVEPGKRKYLPAEAYRFLALAALAHRRGAGMSKGDLAWEIRANHYMATRVLRELVAQGLARVDAGEGGGYSIAATDAGAKLLDANRAYFLATFGAALAEHFRYGRAPAWAVEAGAP